MKSDSLNHHNFERNTDMKVNICAATLNFVHKKKLLDSKCKDFHLRASTLKGGLNSLYATFSLNDKMKGKCHEMNCKYHETSREQISMIMGANFPKLPCQNTWFWAYFKPRI